MTSTSTFDPQQMQTTSGDAALGQTATLPPHDVTDLGLADEGVRRIEWAEREMPVLRLIRERFEREQPLEGIRIAACLHVTTETANLMRTLKAGGAEVSAGGVQPAVHQGRRGGRARRGVRHQHVRASGRGSRHLLRAPQRGRGRPSRSMTMDDGCDLVSLLHKERPGQLPEVLAGTEETTTGVIRLKAMSNDGALRFPVVAVNEAKTKHLFDNRYGTGQSTVDGIVRATNILLAGRRVVVAGYGWVGRGIASRFAGMGSHVAIVEVDPVAAIEALMDGYQVITAPDAATWGQLFITATGNLNVFRREHFEVMQRRRHPGQQRPLRRRAGAQGARGDGRWPHPRGAPERAGVRAGGRPPDPRRGRGPPRQPGRRRGPPGRRDGHVLRGPGAQRGVRDQEPRVRCTPGVYTLPADVDTRDRAPQAGGAGHRPRGHDAGAEALRRVLAGGHLIPA